MTVGLQINALRRQRGLTLEELSALCGVHRDDLGLYERGAMTPRPETVARIARALDVPIAAIQAGMGWTAPRPTEDWETARGDSLLRDGILEAAREAGDFPVEEQEVLALLESVKASIPALVEHMKDTRPEAVIHREILEELRLAPEEEPWELTDSQWEQLRELLPSEKSGRGRAFKSNRLMLDGILYWMRSGAAWKDLPARYGRYKCVSDRLRLWSRTGVWEPVLQKLVEIGVLDETSVRRADEGTKPP